MDHASPKRNVLLWGQRDKSSSEEIFNVLNEKDIMNVACGGSHSMALSSDGRLYCWGDGRSGQLGLGKEIRTVEDPHLIHFEEGELIKKVWCGFAQTAALTEKNNLYLWGFDCFLGPIFEPRLLKTFDELDIIDVALGTSSSMILVKPKDSLSLLTTQVMVCFFIYSL